MKFGGGESCLAGAENAPHPSWRKRAYPRASRPRPSPSATLILSLREKNCLNKLYRLEKELTEGL